MSEAGLQLFLKNGKNIGKATVMGSKNFLTENIRSTAV